MQAELMYTTTEYSGKKPHTEYSIKVSNESLQWMLRKRFSEFVELRHRLLQQDHNESDYLASSLIPALPSRFVSYSTSMKEETINERAKLLQEFMNSLLAATKDCPNRYVFQFFGAVSTSLNNVHTSLTNTSALQQRGLIAIDTYCEQAQVGDIILFRCTFPMSVLQRTVTGADWDHIGIVVPGKDASYLPPQARRQLRTQAHSHVDANTVNTQLRALTRGQRILESSGSGVTCLSLRSRLRAYHEHQCIEYMAVRQLMHTKTRPHASNTTPLTTADTNTDTRIPHKDAYSSYMSGISTAQSSERVSENVSVDENVVDATMATKPHAQTQMHVEVTMVEAASDKVITTTNTQELENTSTTTAEFHLQLERGLRWPTHVHTPTSEDETDEVPVSSLHAHIHAQTITTHRFHVAHTRISQINAFVQKVEGKGYGFKIWDLFATKTVTSPTQLQQEVKLTIDTPTHTSMPIQTRTVVSPSTQAELQSTTQSQSPNYLGESLARAYRAWDTMWTSASATAAALTSPASQTSTPKADEYSTLLEDDELPPSPSQQANGTETSNKTQPPASTSPPQPAQNEKYFCSELVAFALKEMGVIPASLNPGYFWPGSFASGALLDEVIHETGYRYGVEMVIDFKVNEVATSEATEPSTQSHRQHRACRVDQRVSKLSPSQELAASEGNVTSDGSVGLSMPFSQQQGSNHSGSDNNSDYGDEMAEEEETGADKLKSDEDIEEFGDFQSSPSPQIHEASTTTSNVETNPSGPEDSDDMLSTLKPNSTFVPSWF